MISTDQTLYLILGGTALLVVFVVWRYQRCDRNPFDLLDLIMENGRASRLAAAFFVTLIVTSWIMVKLAIDQKMSEGYLIAYGGMWISPILAKMFATSPPAVTKE